MIGPILIITGLYWMWVVFHGKADAMWNAITGNSGFNVTLNDLAAATIPAINQSNSSTGTGKSPTVTGNQADSGTHMGIDSGGNIVTINSSYANMTPAQKDAANTYAHQIGNVG